MHWCSSARLGAQPALLLGTGRLNLGSHLVQASEATQEAPASCGDKRHTSRYTCVVKPFRWAPEKNAELLAGRGISFEQVVVAVEGGGLLDVLAHPNPKRYSNQRVMVVTWDEYVYLVPFVEQDDHYFLKTVIPSRKATRDYLNQG